MSESEPQCLCCCNAVKCTKFIVVLTLIFTPLAALATAWTISSTASGPEARAPLDEAVQLVYFALCFVAALLAYRAIEARENAKHLLPLLVIQSVGLLVSVYKAVVALVAVIEESTAEKAKQPRVAAVSTLVLSALAILLNVLLCSMFYRVYKYIKALNSRSGPEGVPLD